MNVGYGCNIFYMLEDARICSKMRLLLYSPRNCPEPVTSSVQSSLQILPFLPSKEGTVFHGVEYPNVDSPPLKHHCTSLYHL